MAGSDITDAYTLFGIDRKLALDLEELQRRFYSLSREWHPDRFARASAAERASAERKSAALNDAWRTLRDPVSRAELVLKDAGYPIGEQRGKDVPADLLEEVFALNMALEEARDGDSAARGEVAEALTRFEDLLAALDAERDALFAAYDAAPAQERLAELRGLLNKRKYLQNLVRDARAAVS